MSDFPLRVDYTKVLNAPTNTVLYGTGVNAAVSAVAVNSTGTRKFLRQVSSGVPTWDTLVAGDFGTTAQAQFNSIGLGEAASSVQGVILATLGANNVIGYRVKRFTDTSPTGKFISLQSAAGADLYVVDITGAITVGSFKGSSPVAPAYGGTGQDTSSSTGIPFITAGVWSVKASISPPYTAQGTNFTAVVNSAYMITAAGVTVTLPASPSDGDTVTLIDGATVTAGTTIIGRNGKKIMGLSEDMTIDTNNFQLRLLYRSSTGDWRLSL